MILPLQSTIIIWWQNRKKFEFSLIFVYDRSSNKYYTNHLLRVNKKNIFFMYLYIQLFNSSIFSLRNLTL